MGEEERKTRGEIIGKKVRAIRESKGMSRKRLWELLDGIYTYDALTRLELGKLKDPPTRVLAKIAEVLGVPLEELLKEEERIAIASDIVKDPDVMLLMYHAKDLSPNDKKILLKILEVLKEERERKREGEQNT
jgi:transcriptional regulator with XRE-family HTH domain